MSFELAKGLRRAGFILSLVMRQSQNVSCDYLSLLFFGELKLLCRLLHVAPHDLQCGL